MCVCLSVVCDCARDQIHVCVGMDMDERMDESLYPTSGPLLRHWMSICLEALNGKSQRKVFPLSRIHTHILISHTLEHAYECTHTTHIKCENCLIFLLHHSDVKLYVIDAHGKKRGEKENERERERKR